MPVTQTVEDRINQMKLTQSIWLAGSDLFWHYITVWIVLFIPAKKIYDIITSRFFNESFNSLFWGGFFWIILAVLLYLLQKKRLKFTVIDISIDENDFKNAVTVTANGMKWAVEFVTSDLVVANSGSTWYSWGQYITIIRTEKNILFNSIAEPNRASIATWGRNKNNREVFEKVVRKLSTPKTKPPAV